MHYSSVINLPDKRDDIHYDITYVKWCDRAEQDAPREIIAFHTIGEVEIILPPKLPRGYEMQWHSSWDTLIRTIYNKYEAKNYSFDYLDSVIADEYILYNLGIKLDYELINYALHPEYMKYVCEIENSWELLKSSLDKLYKKLANRPPTKGKPNRGKAPDLENFLENMLLEAQTFSKLPTTNVSDV